MPYSQTKKNIWLHGVLLILWIILGAILRFTNLADKPPWADEWATLVFSLGNSFLTIPLETIIPLETLLEPVRIYGETGIHDVVSNLLAESTHPPIYFVLNHLWLKLFSHPEELVSLELARSLSAGLGVLGIPAMFIFGLLVSNSGVTGQFAAALMALSPYGVYLAQETRHYTLVILLVIASVSCLIVAVRSTRKQQPIPIYLTFIWIVINSLGVATHYFFALTLVTETLVLLTFFLKDLSSPSSSQSSSYSQVLQRWRNIGIAILGTIAGCLVWVYTWLNIPDNQLTDWTSHGNHWSSEFYEPILRLTAWIATMIVLLPLEGTPIWVTIVSGIILLIIFLWLLVTITKYFKQQQNASENLVIGVISKFLAFAFLLILIFVYFGDRDLTLAARFQFFYFPAILMLVAGVFSHIWQNKILSGKYLVILTLLIGFAGGLAIINNYVYQKPDRSDLVVPIMLEAQQLNPQVPTLIAIVRKTHEQTGEIMGIAWEWNRLLEAGEVNRELKSNLPLFLLLQKKGDAEAHLVTKSLHHQIALLPRPLDVWVVNFAVPATLGKQNCDADPNYQRRVAGYRYRLYHCD